MNNIFNIKIIILFVVCVSIFGILFSKLYTPVFVSPQYKNKVKIENHQIKYKKSSILILFPKNSSIPITINGIDTINFKKIQKIIGRADDIGDSSYNINLSKKRVESVNKYLLAKDSSLVFLTEWYGSNNPVAINDEKYRFKNRSVEIIIDNK